MNLSVKNGSLRERGRAQNLDEWMNETAKVVEHPVKPSQQYSSSLKTSMNEDERDEWDFSRGIRGFSGIMTYSSLFTVIHRHSSTKNQSREFDCKQKPLIHSFIHCNKLLVISNNE